MLGQVAAEQKVFFGADGLQHLAAGLVRSVKGKVVEVSAAVEA